MIRYHAVIIVHDDKHEAEANGEGNKLFNDKVLGTAGKRTCSADKVHDADAEYEQSRL